MDKYSRN